MTRVYAIALNSYREAIRDRVLLGVVGVAVASLIFGLLMASLPPSEQARILTDHGIVTISWLANLVAIFLGASFLYKEIELRTLYVILAKPVARWQFILGKYLGILMTAIVFVASTASILLVLLNLQSAELPSQNGASAPWFAHEIVSSRSARVLAFVIVTLAAVIGTRLARRNRAIAAVRDDIGAAITVLGALAVLIISAWMAHAVAPDETAYVLKACLLVTAEVAITAALATLCSAFSTPFVTGIITLGLFLVGRSAGALLDLKDRRIPAEARSLLHGLARVVPNLQLYVPSRDALIVHDGGGLVAGYIANVLGYSVLYAGVLLFFAAIIFRRRDLV